MAPLRPSELLPDAARWLERRLLANLPPALRQVVENLTAPPTPTGRVAVPADPAIERLGRIDHVVVLMMENRSFDQMLGYLKLTGRDDVDGLRGDETEHDESRVYRVHHLDRTHFGRLEDPCHSGRCVDEQLDPTRGGFVGSFRRERPHAPDPGLVMGYYDAGDVPVYDFLAREFCVCDRWFASVPGATWPNRLYAIAGRAAASRDDVEPPVYHLPAFVRYLDQAGVSWRWYSHDPGTLRLVDPRYRFDHHDNFAFFDKRKIRTVTRAAEGSFLAEGASFLDDAAAGQLPKVSWIDPNFIGLSVFDPNSNDDHPPSDVMAGQALALAVYDALRSSPQWDRTLLLITYDEHGGFYDHVVPPTAPDDDPAFRRYGVRVPALVVSPWLESGSVGRQLFDHTSIIKTILLRFCRAADGTIPDMGRRVTEANHLGGLLTRGERRSDAPAPHEPAAVVAQWRGQITQARMAALPTSPPQRLTHLQQGVAQAARALRAGGLPAGQP